jgi:hypothetical protein
MVLSPEREEVIRTIVTARRRNDERARKEGLPSVPDALSDLLAELDAAREKLANLMAEHGEVFRADGEIVCGACHMAGGQHHKRCARLPEDADG